MTKFVAGFQLGLGFSLSCFCFVPFAVVSLSMSLPPILARSTNLQEVCASGAFVGASGAWVCVLACGLLKHMTLQCDWACLWPTSLQMTLLCDETWL